HTCPLISVIVPVYKVEKYLNRCINSIVNQTYWNLEIILVDDGSPDNCPLICDEWSKKDKRIRVLHKRNGGLSSARNAGLDIAKGEYISFIDSDDFILPEMFEELYRLMIENDADLGMSGYLYVDENGLPVQDTRYIYVDKDGLPIQNKNNTKDEVVDVFSGEEALRDFITLNLRVSHDMYRGVCYIVAWNKLYKSHIFRNLRFFYQSPCEDDAAVHHILGECRRLAATNRKLYMYTQREDSIMGNLRKGFDVELMTGMLFALNDRYDYLIGKGLDDLAHEVLCQSCIWAFSMLRNASYEASYVKHFIRFNSRLLPLFLRCVASPGIKMKHRAVRLFLEVVRNIIRDIYRATKKLFLKLS
ncbi:MAG: glycosyltransferase, partial [Synergistaceae bacterium]|nr:glycosyltransferase [Synergistaceae bacterium]MBQ3448888.1 glycosyltransferase [Synergistaceae bacterium]